ncbi:ankyrin repeat domain-containing protein [uncultured Treponema sp.]|uniref:ankyrin repeat domain-containing protein n=1 Tax=uncultured Treponema sp. TaxID=162155 RepID=UPI002598BF5C|nr:ankyrin repeat domain-containing protein [uncultured Treponema sp.]
MKRKCFLSFFALMICTLGFAASDADIALFNAVKVKRLDLVNAYVRSANANARFQWSGKSMTAFQMALENEDVNIAKVLIADGNADVNASWEDEPPIFIAARKKNPQLAELLIGSGANINSTYNGMTPAIYSVMAEENAGPFLHSFESIAKKYGKFIEWNSKDSEGRNVLHYAVTEGDFGNLIKHGNKSTVEYLLRSGLVSASEQDKYGMTSFHMAAASCNNDLMKLFLNTPNGRKAYNIKNSDGYTPIALYLANAAKYNISYTEVIMQAVSDTAMFKIGDFNFPPTANTKNGITIICADSNNIDDNAEIIRIISENNASLAELEVRKGIPLLCHAIKNKYSPTIVDAILSGYSGDWRAIQQFDGKNVQEIMNSNGTARKYQYIFSKYNNNY